MTCEEILNALINFDGTVCPNQDDVDADIDTDLHDNHLLPPGCKRYDEWADCDMDELLGVYE